MRSYLYGHCMSLLRPKLLVCFRVMHCYMMWQKRVDEERKRGRDGGVDDMHQRSHVYEAVSGLEYELHDDNNDDTSTAVKKMVW